MPLSFVYKKRKEYKVTRIDNTSNMGNVTSIRQSNTNKVDDDKPKNTVVESVHIYLDNNGDVEGFKNISDKDSNVYVYMDGKLILTLPPGTEYNGKDA